MHRPWLAGCAHGTASIESILSELIEKLAHPFCQESYVLLLLLNAVLSCTVSARFTCLAVVMIRDGRSHGVEDHGNNTLSVLFKLMSCLSVGQKHCVSVAARRPFRKSQIHQNFLQAWPWAFSKNKKNTLRNCLCPRGLRGCDSFCPRRELSDIDGWACARRPHTHTRPYTLYTRIHIQQWERAVLLGSLLQTTRKVKRKWRKSRACCFVWENVPFWNCRLFTTSGFDFSTMFESCWSKNCTNLFSSIHDQSARARQSRLIWSPKRHFVAIDLPVAEKTPKCMCYPILGQRKLKANNVDRQLASRKAQSSSCFDLDSDRVTVLVPQQTEVSMSVWGNPRNWGIPFSRPISARLFILAPRPFPGDPVR